MLKEIYFYQEMATEHQLQENGRGPVPFCKVINFVWCLSSGDYINVKFGIKHKNNSKLKGEEPGCISILQ